MSAQTDLTSVAISSGYTSLYRVGDTNGLEATEHTLYDGDGTAAPVSIGTGQISILTGKTINIVDVGALKIAGVSVSTSAAELNYLDITTLGTAEARFQSLF